MSRPFRTSGEPVPQEPLVHVPILSGRLFLEPGQQPPAKPPRFPSKPAPGRPPRRGFLAAVSALAVGPAVAVAGPATPDAELIAACEAATEAKRASDAANRYPVDAPIAVARAYENEADRLAAISDRHAARALAMPAKTRQGLIAKARMALAIAARDADGSIDLDWHAIEAWAVVEEVLRLEALA
ncbi:hypothetical protein [Roseomonas chloroacetimidivorans]|uniref:hypothetical protein n=1 Tax=Roseomonas chloroacetimidivorans TaxID=1766656 RepID=UPI003C781B1F